MLEKNTGRRGHLVWLVAFPAHPAARAGRPHTQPRRRTCGGNCAISKSIFSGCFDDAVFLGGNLEMKVRFQKSWESGGLTSTTAKKSGRWRCMHNLCHGSGSALSLPPSLSFLLSRSPYSSHANNANTDGSPFVPTVFLLCRVPT